MTVVYVKEYCAMFVQFSETYYATFVQLSETYYATFVQLSETYYATFVQFLEVLCNIPYVQFSAGLCNKRNLACASQVISINDNKKKTLPITHLSLSYWNSVVWLHEVQVPYGLLGWTKRKLVQVLLQYLDRDV